MPAYVIAEVEVTNPAGYETYRPLAGTSVAQYGGRFVVRGGKHTGVEGQARSRNVVIEFPDYDTALACYHSPEYQENIKRRQPHSIAELVVVEGYDGPQP